MAGSGAGRLVHADGPAAVAGIVGTVLLSFVLIVTTVYVIFFLDAFVVPLMHRHDLRVMAAWRRFLELFRQRPGWFLLSGLFVFVLLLFVTSAVIVTGFLTCCVGFVLVAVPFVGTVLLLPLIVTYRAFTVEFLAQVDGDVRLEARA